MSKSIKVVSNEEAWKLVDKLFPSDYEKDECASKKAGYPIYRGVKFYDYICDLTNRIEINLSDGSTINIWIDDEPVYTVNEVKEIIRKAKQDMEYAKRVLSLIDSMDATEFTTKIMYDANLQLTKSTNTLAKFGL